LPRAGRGRPGRQNAAGSLGRRVRDAGFEDVILLLLDSAHNRRFVRALGSAAARFQVDGHLALERLAAGVAPGGSAIILL
jgi:hypothetical protein